MKKGFTLIELLAVIVILAIIALIATPMILGVIDSAKKGAAENSTYGYIDAIEKSDLKNMIDTENYTARTDGTYDLSTLANVSYKGQSPTAVCVIIKDGNVENGSFQFDNYIVDYSNGKAKVNNQKTEIDCAISITTIEFTPNESSGRIEGVVLTVHNDVNGIDMNSLKYIWTTTTVQPNESDFLNTFQNGDKILMSQDPVSVYYLWILASDTKGNQTIKRSGQYKLDTTSPVITINGADQVSIKQGITYIDEGATAQDDYDGNIPVQVLSNLNPNLAGTYQITYIARDQAGNETTVVRTVTVYEEEANVPRLSEGMTPIKWVNGVETVTTSEDPEWYDYSKKLWANVKTNDGSYWVWIPRYAYKITSGYHSSTAGSIDVKFLKGTSDTTFDGTNIQTSGYVAGTNDTSMHYFTHPVFQNSINQYGYWVAKFEPTATEGVANGYYSDWSCPVVGDNVSTKTIKVVPNVSSWRCVAITNAYKASVAMKTKTVYGWTSTSVDTHMATNQEWGAVYYLTLSKYGANNNEVYINNSQTYTTGCAGNTASEAAYNGCQNAYNSEVGVKASTTWNITGVYDMSGGSWERTMGVYNNLLASSGFTTTEYNSLPSSHITKYTTATVNLFNNIGMDYDATVYGDGVYETSLGANRYNGTVWSGTDRGEWGAEHSYLPHTSGSWFVRGTTFNSMSIAGLGGFGCNWVGLFSYDSFRPIVSVIK